MNKKNTLNCFTLVLYQIDMRCTNHPADALAKVNIPSFVRTSGVTDSTAAQICRFKCSIFRALSTKNMYFDIDAKTTLQPVKLSERGCQAFNSRPA